MTRGVRGATTVEEDKEQVIVRQTEDLLRELIGQNGIEAEHVCSVIISATSDLTAAFPAKALRNIDGWTYVPVMCVREIEVPGSLEKCIRIMLHWNTEKSQQDINHVYLNRAVSLRPDLIK
ncbi:chorismate mutase [Bacillus sp. 1P06AnD]|uniref:chorismate mutase n=1 Tax=Bacillus sp. 1P06AnD TaxID=3132208 RepID=UPI0039A1A76F